MSLSLRKIPIKIALCGLCLSASVSQAIAENPPDKSSADTLRVARYSVVSPQPHNGQLDLLAHSRAITLPKSITRVGEALTWLLTDAGYRLIEAERLTLDVKALLALPLPQSHRRFDPLPLRQVLRIVIGPSFALIEDPAHRLVSIERCMAVDTSSSIHRTTRGEA